MAFPRGFTEYLGKCQNDWLNLSQPPRLCTILNLKKNYRFELIRKEKHRLHLVTFRRA